MGLDKLYLNNVGHTLTIKTETGLDRVNSAEIRVTKPNDVGSATWIASISNTSSGTLVYVTKSGDLSAAGTWEGQAYVWETGSSYFHGETFTFEVFNVWD